MQLVSYLKSRMFIKTIIIMVVSVVLGIFLLKYILNVSTHHGEKIPVPDLSKMSLDDAKKTLDNLNLTYVVQDSASYNPEFPPNSVLSHDPELGEHVKEDRKIYLTLNATTYRKIPIPNLLGKTKRQVVQHLKAIGFEIGKYSYIPDLGRDVVRKMTFKGKEVKAGDMIPKMSVIDLVLGDGKE